MADESLTFGLSQNILLDFENIFSHYPEIQQVLIFGSRAKNTFKDGSDIDLAVFASNMETSRFTQLWNEIDNLPLVFRVDCIHWDQLNNQALKSKIIAEGRVFYSPSSRNSKISPG